MKIKIAKEDLLRVREIGAEKGTEFTLNDIVEAWNDVMSTPVEIIDEPGLVTELRKLRISRRKRENGSE